MDQELFMKASEMEKRHNELQENLQYIDSQISELSEFSQSIKSFDEFEGKEIISSIGKGVHAFTELKSKSLLVEVGSGIALKKSPKEALEIVENQIGRIQQAKLNILSEIDSIRSEFQQIISNMEENKGNDQ